MWWVVWPEGISLKELWDARGFCLKGIWDDMGVLFGGGLACWWV